jgi:hypothetical protein
VLELVKVGTMKAGFRRVSGKIHMSEALFLDLARLKKVRESLGELGWWMAFLDGSRALQESNKALGKRLIHSDPKDRLAMVDAFLNAESELPAEVRTPRVVTAAPAVNQVRENGCADLGQALTDNQLADIHAYLRAKPVLLAHDGHHATEMVPSIDDVPVGQNYASYNYLDIWSCPHVIEAASRDAIVDLAQGYLGCTPTLYSINAFWSLPNSTPHKATQLFHRDLEDARSIVVFTLLTAVDEPDEGAHYYVERSHDLRTFEPLMKARGAGSDDMQGLFARDGAVVASNSMRWFEESARRFDGPAGHSFCIDGYGLHRALVPRSRPRLLLWFRFGNFFNTNAYRLTLPHMQQDVAKRILSRIPATPRHRYVFRYMMEALAAA